MRTALDSNILSALFTVEPTSDAVVAQLGLCRTQGPLIISGVVYSEIHAAPNMTPALLQDFLGDTGIHIDTATSLEDWSLSGEVFAAYADRRRKSGEASRDVSSRRLYGWNPCVSILRSTLHA